MNEEHFPYPTELPATKEKKELPLVSDAKRLDVIIQKLDTILDLLSKKGVAFDD